jgi:crotonobetainyl-CoA:carnitine CoA-transferase CaiB-like acyl-CoA transferase
MLLAGVVVIDATDRLGWLAGRVLADLGADVVKLEPQATDRTRHDWRAFNVNKRVLDLGPAKPAAQPQIEELLAKADICLLTPGCSSADKALDADTLRQRFPHLVVVVITPFGRVGPRKDWRASDIELMAAGGAMSLAGEPDGVPLRVSEPQSYSWVGAQAAIGALIALFRRDATGCGDLVDVSAQASVVIAAAHAPAFFDLNGIIPKRAGAFMTGRSITGARYRVFWPCRDGWLNFIFYGGVAGRRANERLAAWMRERGAELGPLATIDWARFDPTKMDQAEVDAVEAPVMKFLAGITKREFLIETHKREILGYPVSTVADIATDPQLEARGYFQTVGGERHCSSFAVIDGARPPLRYAAGTPLVEEPRESRRASATVASRLIQALDGIKVVEFGGYAAGPHIGKILGNFGAKVVHVESRDRPDGFRLQYPPYPGNRPGLNRSGCFSLFNDSKYGVTIDLKKPEGGELARRLAQWCDLIVENMRPGVMERLGLGFDALSQINPRLVMLSTCNMGQTGPRADTPGFGSQLSALAGFCGMTGFPDGPPMILYGPYIDFAASLLGCSAAVAGLVRSRRTGKGTSIDLSQYECGLLFMAGALQEYFATGRLAERCGNDDPEAVPHGAFPCRNGEWVALSCWSNDEFKALAGIIGQSRLALDADFATPAARRAHKGKLDEAISAWSGDRSAEAVAQTLQAAGIRAYPVVTMAGLFSDPQLAARRQWRVRRHPEMGDQAYCFPGFDLTEMPGDIVCAAPCLGNDNDFVCRDLLGLSDSEMEEFQQRGVFG